MRHLQDTKSSPEQAGDTYDDIFGPPRTDALTCASPRHRIPMISGTYRKKEERRKVLKLSIQKLNKIMDAEANLRRSVLVNNLTVRLQEEAREEKKQKNQRLNYPVLCDTDIYSNISSEMLKCDEKYEPNLTATDEPTHLNHPSDHPPSSRKRKLDEEDENVDEVLAQFLMTPTPTLITEIDDKPEPLHVEVVSMDPLAKRLKLEKHQEKTTTLDLENNIVYANLTSNSLSSNLIPNNSSNISETDLLSPPESLSSNLNSSFSCGQASLLGEQTQSNFLYSLVAGFESL